MEIERSSLQVLERDGVLIIPSFISETTVNQVKKELSGWSKVSFNHQAGAQVIGGNLWIENLGACSESALKLALDPIILKLLDEYFQEKAILGTLKYQKKITGQKGIPLHRDRGPGIVMFVFLTDISPETGATRFIKGTHRAEAKDVPNWGRRDDADYVDPTQFHGEGDSIVAYGGAGTTLLYSQKTWHDLPKFKKPGREILWAIYYPITQSSQAADQLFRHNILTTLSSEQKERLLHDTPAQGLSFTKFGETSSFVDSYSIASWKIILSVVRYYIYRIIRKSKSGTWQSTSPTKSEAKESKTRNFNI